MIRFQGALASLTEAEKQELLDRGQPEEQDKVIQNVRAIIQDVKRRGDASLIEMAKKFDGATLSSVEVSAEACEAAYKRVSPAIVQSLERAAKNIAAAHEAQKPHEVVVETEPGIQVGRRPDPLGRAGVYAPGGRAAYPSSVLMGAVPARVAGVKEVILCSPPGKSGLPSDEVLAAAHIAKVDRILALGGAGAIAAMAYGTQSVPAVDRIVGPGNAYVAEAKIQVQSRVAIDSPAGPSELFALIDDSADAASVCREMLAQAEHDPDAAVVTLSTSQQKAEEVIRLIEQMAPQEPRAEIVLSALKSKGAVLWTEDKEGAIAFANAFAAEHLLLQTQSLEDDLAKLLHAGTIFIGNTSSVAHGDYMTGSNHVLPTAGLARVYSGLSVLDFYRWTSWQKVSPLAAANMAEDIDALASAEGLHAHAAAARALGKKK